MGTPGYKTFVIRAPRFLGHAIISGRPVNNELVAASPEFPVEIELPEGIKVDPGLIPAGSKEATEKLLPHYVVRDGRGMPTAAEVTSKPIVPQVKGKG